MLVGGLMLLGQSADAGLVKGGTPLAPSPGTGTNTSVVDFSSATLSTIDYTAATTLIDDDVPGRNGATVTQGVNSLSNDTSVITQNFGVLLSEGQNGGAFTVEATAFTPASNTITFNVALNNSLGAGKAWNQLRFALPVTTGGLSAITGLSVGGEFNDGVKFNLNSSTGNSVVLNPVGGQFSGSSVTGTLTFTLADPVAFTNRLNQEFQLVTTVTAVPEPATMTMAGLGLLVVGGGSYVRRRRQKKAAV